MNTQLHKAIFALDSRIKTVSEIDGNFVAFDSDDNEVSFDLQTAQTNLALKSLRETRNQLLAETDYLGLPDLGGFSAEMTAYRQALRDLPANTADPANPVWPTKP